MNKNFWDEMVKVWCRTTSQTDQNIIQLLAARHAENDKAHTSGYSINPLDDDDEEDEW